MNRNSGSRTILLLIFLIFVNIFFVEYYIHFIFELFIVSIIASIAGLYYGSESFVDESEAIGSRLGMTGSTIGLVLISLGSVADEIFVSVIAAVHGRGDLGFGNIQGSNVITILPFFAFLPFYFKDHHKGFSIDSVLLIISSVLLIFMAVSFVRVPAYFAVFPLSFFVLYFVYRSRGSRQEIRSDEKLNPAILVLSLLLIYFASDSIVKYTVQFSYYYSMPFFLSGFIIAGVAGSLPEVFMTLISFRKMRPDMAFGVIVGSTIYKVTLVLGLVTSIGNLTVQGGVWSTYVLLIMCLVLLAYTRVEKRTTISILSAFGIVASVAMIAFGI